MQMDRKGSVFRQSTPSLAGLEGREREKARATETTYPRLRDYEGATVDCPTSRSDYLCFSAHSSFEAVGVMIRGGGCIKARGDFEFL